MSTSKTPEPLIRSYRYKPKIESAAQDINTYVKPQEMYIAPPQGTTALASLAGALRETSPILTKYFKDQQDKKNQEMVAEGERVQKETNLKTWADLVRKDPKYEKYNPYLKEGFEKQSALSRGADYQLWLQDKLVNDETLAGLKDQTEINEYIDKQTSEYMKNNLSDLSDKAVTDFFVPSANNSRQALMSQFANKKLDEVMQDKYDAYEENITKNSDSFIVGNAKAITSSEEESTALAGQLAAQISAFAGNTIIDVSNPKKVNDSTMNAVLTWYQSLDTEYKSFGAKVVENLTGKDNQKLVGIARYQLAFNKVKKEARNEQVQKDKDDLWYEERSKQIKANQAIAEYGQQIADNPMSNHQQMISEAFSKYGPDGADAVRKWASSCQSYASSNWHLGQAMSGGTGGGGGGGGSTEKAMAQYSFFQSIENRTPTQAELNYAVSHKLITPLQAIKLAKGEGPSKEMLDVAETCLNTCLATYGITNQSLQDPSGVDTLFKLKAKFKSEVLSFNTDFTKKNGRAPTAEESQEHFVKFATNLNAAQEKINKQQNIVNELTKGANKGKVSKLTPESFNIMLDDYKKNGVTSALVQLKANSGVKYRRMSMSQFVKSLAESNGIKLTASMAVPKEDTAPATTTTSKSQKRGHKM